MDDATVVNVLNLAGVNSTATRAIRLAWDSRPEEAIALLEHHKDRVPRFALHFAEVKQLLTMVTGRRGDSAVHLSLMQQAQSLAREYIGDPSRAIANGLVPEGDELALQMFLLDCKVVVADTYFFIGIECMKLNSKLVFQHCNSLDALSTDFEERLKGAWKLRKAWVHYEAVMKEIECLQKAEQAVNQDVVNAVKFGVGIFWWVLSWLPSMLMKVLGWIGFEADREKGQLSLRECYEYRGVRCTFAAFVLMADNLIMPRAFSDVEPLLASAEEILHNCLEYCPDGAMFLWMNSFLMRKRGDWRGALGQMDRAIERSRVGFGVAPQTFILDKAYCMLMGQLWEDSLNLLQEILDTPDSIFRALAALTAASCLQMLSREEEAQAMLARVPSLVGNSAKDVYAVHFAEKSKNRTTGLRLVPFELIYLRRDLHHLLPDDISSILRQLDDTAARFAKLKPEEEAIMLLLRGTMLYLLGRGEEGVECLEKACKFGSSSEKHTYPFCCYELAEIRFKTGDLDQVQELLTQASKVKGYVYEDVLKTRLKLAQQTLDAAKKRKAQQK